MLRLMDHSYWLFMTRKPSPAVFRSRELDLFLRGRTDSDDKFLKWIEDMEKVLKENMFAGDQVKKDRIPSYYVQRYGVNNLFRYDHPGDIVRVMWFHMLMGLVFVLLYLTYSRMISTTGLSVTGKDDYLTRMLERMRAWSFGLFTPV